MANEQKPKAAEPSVDNTTLLAAIVEQNKMMAALLQKLSSAADANPVEEILAQRKEEAEFKAKMDRLKAEASLPLAERNRRIAAERFKGPFWFQVRIPKAKEWPTIPIPAHSPQEAEGFYRDMCGIISSEHKIEVLTIAAPTVSA